MTRTTKQLSGSQEKAKFPTNPGEILRAKDVMTSTVIAVEPSEPLREVANLLLSNSISGVPVVDVDAHVLGMITEGDLIMKEEGTDPLARSKPLISFSKRTRKFFEAYEGRTAGQAMTTPVITATPTTPVRQIAAMMRKAGIRAMPIVEKERLVGIVARRDLLKAFRRSDQELRAAAEKSLRGFGLDITDISVIVEEGVVRVIGYLPTRTQCDYVDGAIRSIDSVIDVDLGGLRYRLDDISDLNRGAF